MGEVLGPKSISDSNAASIYAALLEAERTAEEAHGGHLTIMRFTMGWKAMYGTPDLDTGAGREQVSRLPMASSLVDALAFANITPDE